MSREVGRVHDVEYRMALPSCWTRLPMEPTAMRTAARAYLLRKYAKISRDETVRLRRQLEEDLVALTRRPGAEYARMLLALSMDVAGRPVSASCLVSVVDQDLSDEKRLDRLRQSQNDAGTHDCAVVDVGGHRGLVVVRDEVTRAPLPDDPAHVAAQARRVAVEMGWLDDADDPEAVRDSLRFETDSRAVDVWLPVPDDHRAVLMQFSTSLRALFDPLTELFLLTACTVQFRRPDGSWA